jgi:hypothetical protein
MQNIPEPIATTLSALKVKGFDARYAENKEAAKKLIIEIVPPDWVVGIGDSATVRSLGVIPDLMDLGNRVLNPFLLPKVLREKPGATPFRVTKQTAQACDVFLSGCNAVTMDGKLVNIDGGGMRVTGQAFGSMISIMVIGRNKIVKDTDSAIYRIKNVLAPAHGKTVSSDWGIPCVATGKCVEPQQVCKGGLSRMCNVIVIIEAQPNMRDTKIVPILVNEDLGLGCDPAWPQERIDKIYAEYKKFTPPHRPVK